MKKIQHLIVPTDFSVTALNTYKYARHLAHLLNADVTVVHAKEYYLPNFDSSMMAVTPIDHEQLEQQLAAFVADGDSDEMRYYKPTLVKKRVLEGAAVSTIVELSEKENADLIVIGTTGLSDFITFMTGSTSLLVARQAHCPVLLVPSDAKWHRIDRILYAADEPALNEAMVTQIGDFALSIDASVHFVHVSEPDPSIGNHIKPFVWGEQLHVANPALTYETHTLFGHDKTKALQTYIGAHHISLVAMVSRKRGFWENLTHTSVIKAMVTESEIPIWVQHFDD